MYGQHKVPLKFEQDGVSISFGKSEGLFIYRRSEPGEEVESIILEAPEKIIINPVEPCNLPKKVSHHLLIEFSRPVVIGPSGDETIYLNFPVEIGVFLSRKRATDLIDTFSLNKQKFTLYGSPRGGSICKYWRSEVFEKVPAVEPLLEGVLALRITSAADSWVTIRRIVLDAYGMKIRFTQDMVATKAEMKVISEGNAETVFVETALHQGMQKSVELFRLSKLAVTSAHYHMSEGL